MALTIPPVNPGDLITSEFMNLIGKALMGLDTRLSKLESTGPVANPVRIDGFTATSPVHVGDQIEIDGAGFLVPSVLNTVTMGGAPVTGFSMQSGAAKLFFTVPPIPNLAGNGTPVTVTVTNANGSATSPSITVFPASIAPTGATQLLYTMPPVMPNNQQNITQGQAYVFTFTITSITDRGVTYNLTPSIGAGWSAQLLDQSPLPMSANATQQFRVQVTAGAGTGTLTLAAIETTPGTQVTPGNLQLTITTGSPPPVPDNRVRVTLSQAGLGASVVGNVLQFKRGQQGGVKFTVLFTQGGTYNINPTMQTPAGWSRDSLDVSVAQVNQPAPGQTSNQDVNVLFTPSANAANTNLLFAVTGGNNLSVTYTQPVTVV